MKQLDKDGKNIRIGQYVLTRTGHVGKIIGHHKDEEIYFHIEFMKSRKDGYYLFVGRSLTRLSKEQVVLFMFEPYDYD